MLSKGDNLDELLDHRGVLLISLHSLTRTDHESVHREQAALTVDDGRSVRPVIIHLVTVIQYHSLHGEVELILVVVSELHLLALHFEGELIRRLLREPLDSDGPRLVRVRRATLQTGDSL